MLTHLSQLQDGLPRSPVPKTAVWTLVLRRPPLRPGHDLQSIRLLPRTFEVEPLSRPTGVGSTAWASIGPPELAAVASRCGPVATVGAAPSPKSALCAPPFADGPALRRLCRIGRAGESCRPAPRLSQHKPAATKRPLHHPAGLPLIACAPRERDVSFQSRGSPLRRPHWKKAASTGCLTPHLEASQAPIANLIRGPPATTKTVLRKSGGSPIPLMAVWRPARYQPTPEA